MRDIFLGNCVRDELVLKTYELFLILLEIHLSDLKHLKRMEKSLKNNIINFKFQWYLRVY